MRCDPLVILALVRSGHTNAEIAEQLRVSVRTIQRYRAADPDLNHAILEARRDNFWHRPAPCGTTSAYNRHLRRGEPADDACQRANALAGRAHRAKTGPVDTTRGRPRRYPDGLSERAPDASPQALIEQAIARGLPTSQIMSELAVDYRTVKHVRDRMAT